jgi:DNA-binding CsgD family transcriptional regulator/tetratricopeptide (TPR) repeat protein
VLFGRRREQEVVEAAVRSARSGHGCVLAVVGEPGIGKSALLSHAEAVADGMRTLSARGVQSETHVPFAGLFELLRPALGTLERIPAPQADALAGALALRPSRGVDRLAIGAATLSLLAACAERQPLLVLVDDVHWLDGSSGAALRFAARRLASDPVAMLLAVRSGEPSLLDGSDLPLLIVEGLDLSATTDLLRHRRSGPGAGVVPTDVALRLHRETGGNPLALLELSGAGSWREETPIHEPIPAHVTVARAYVERFLALPAGGRKLALLLAASGSDDLSLLARAASASGAPGLDDLAPAEAAGLVSLHGARAEWRHPLVRSAIYGAAAPSERREAHRTLADSLPDAELDRRAWHLSLAVTGPDAATASALEQVGNRARDRSAYQEALLAFERAAELATGASRKAALRYSAADAAWLAGAVDRASRLLDDAAALDPAAPLKVKIEHLRGHVETRRGHVRQARSILLEGAEAAAGVDDSRAVVMLAEAVNACFYAGDPTTMRQIAARIPAAAAQCDDARSAFFGAMGEGMALVFSGKGERGPRLLRRAMSLLESSDELRDDPRLLAWAAMGPIWLRESSDWSRYVDRALTAARGRLAVGVLPFLLLHVGVYDGSTDRWSEAEAAFYESVDLAEEMGQHAERAASLSRLALLEARTGRFARSVEHASEALELSTSLGLGLSELWALTAMGEAALAQGDPKRAAEHYERHRALLVARGINDPDMSPAPELVEIYLRLGLDDRARALAHEFTRAASAKHLPWARARAARARALVAPDEGFDACFEEALAAHRATPDVFETARTHLAYGSRLRRSRQRVRARAELRLALSVFDHLGADPWSEMARVELDATGERVARRGASSITQLTPQELQVATLLGQRRTTREAAAALFLSPKTVEYHIRSIYRKLGIASRDELVAAMGRERVT